MKPIPVSEFSSHVERLHADRDKLFEMEYEVSGLYTITKQETKIYPRGQLLFLIWDLRCLATYCECHSSIQSVSKHPQSSYSVAEIPHNKQRNRFANIFPCKLAFILFEILINLVVINTR